MRVRAVRAILRNNGVHTMTEGAVRDRTGDLEALLGLKGPRPGVVLRPAIIAALFLIAGILAAVFFTGGGSQNRIRYVTEPVSRGGLKVTVTATGSLQPTNQVDVSSELSGTLRRVMVDYNDRVVAGQALAELDTEKLTATVENSRAKLEAARAKARVAEVTVREMESDLQRKRTLADRSYASIHDLETVQALHDRAVASLASARSEVNVAEADLRLNQTNLSKARIYSPISGIVLKRNVDPGQTVASTLQAPVLFTIAEDLTKMEVQVDVDEADVGKVTVGQPATFSVDAYPERTFEASVRDIRFASEVVQGVVTYKAILTVDNSDLLLRPGMTATAQISVQEVKNALLVPNAALRFTPPAQEEHDGRSVLSRFLPGPPRFRPATRPEDTGPSRKVWTLRDGEPVALPLTVGATDGRRSQVTGGELQPGQAVIVDSTNVKK
jgi:HlyD family secretion protein